ncbi:MAG TPA: hypothetical protein PLE45_06685 [Spirochaetota bacterium]|nr:hypothetical protein [Spirochaetota bacterium]HPP04363.1 hypothetical protein [Spirochaetota bacterium]
MKILFFLKRNLYTTIVFIVGALLTLGLIIYFSFNCFRLWQLLLKFKIEFLFLLISGYFLYSFRYDIMKTELSFNAFIIYMSNIILYINPNSEDYGLVNYNSRALVLIIFFVFIYFLIQIPIYLFFKKLTIYKIELILVRIILWTIIIIVINYIIYILKINIINLELKDLILIPFILLVHIIIKLIFSFLERSLQKKYFHFVSQILSFTLIDTIFILFAILLGSIYRKIDLLNTAFFISFLAIVVSLMKYIINRNSLNIVFYYLNSFIDFKNLYNLEYSPILPLDIKIDIDKILDKKIRYLAFVVFRIEDAKIEDILLKLSDKFKKYRFYIYKNYICFIQPVVDFESIKEIHNIKKILDNKIKACYCPVSKSNWNYIDINYLFKILSEILDKKIRNVNRNIIFKVKEEYIFF